MYIKLSGQAPKKKDVLKNDKAYRLAKKTISKAIDPKKRYSLVEAAETIEKLEKYVSSERTEYEVEIMMFNDGEKDAELIAPVTLGYGDGIHVFVYIENYLRSLLQRGGNAANTEEKIREGIRFIEEVKNEYERELSSPTPILDQVPKVAKKKREKIDMKIYIDRFKKPLAFSLAGVLVIGLGFGIHHFLFSNQPSIANGNEVPMEVVNSSKVTPLNDFLEAKRFSEALQEYPQEYPRIERSIFYLGVEGIPYLEDFLKEKDYAKGRFDLAYLKKDYAKVVEMKDEADSDDRLAQLAVAYIKTDQLEEAEKLNESLKSEAISNLVFLVKESKAVGLIKAGNIEEAKTIQDQISSEKLKNYFEQYNALSSAIAEGESTLSSSELGEEDKAAVESAKSQNEESLKQLNENLK